MLFHCIKTVLRFFYRKPEWTGFDNMPHSPAVFVANHNLSYGPVIFFLYKTELGIHGFFGILLAFLISFACVWIMRKVHAVPVYSNSRKICLTMQQSLKELIEGNNLVIFIERRDDQNYKPDSGFLELMDSYCQATGRCLPVYIFKISHPTVKLVESFHGISGHAIIRERVISLLREINEG